MCLGSYIHLQQRTCLPLSAPAGVLYTSKWGNGSAPGGVPGGDEGHGLLTDHLTRPQGVDAGVQTDPLHLMPSQSYTHPTAPGLAGLGLGSGTAGGQGMLWDSAMLPHGGSLQGLLPLERGPSMPSTWRKGESLGRYVGEARLCACGALRRAEQQG
jgi:hypothetical protein